MKKMMNNRKRYKVRGDSVSETHDGMEMDARGIAEIERLQGTLEIQRAILSFSPDAIMALKNGNKLVYANPGTYEMCGYSREEIGLNLTPELLLDAADVGTIRKAFAHAMNHGFKQCDTVMIHKNGARIDVQVQIFAVKNDSNGVWGLGIIVRDISQLKRIQREIGEAKHRLEVALAASNAGVWEADFLRKTVVYDGFVGVQFGLDPSGGVLDAAEFLEELKKIVPAYSKFENLQELVTESVKTSILSEGFPSLHADGTITYFSNFTRLIYDDAKPVKAVGAVFDVTRNIEMQNELVASKETAEIASRSKSRFLSSMSHEFRTPMNAIIGMSELLLAERLSPKQRQYVNDIKTSSTSLAGMIDEVLDFSTIEAGMLKLAPAPYDLRELLCNLKSIFSASAEEKDIEFVLKVAEDLPSRVLGDDMRVRQILINTVGNAIKFTYRGYAELHAYAANGLLCFDVRDTGIGIRKEDLDRIFWDFTQLDKEERHSSGTGLGLPITKSLVQLMKGSISAESIYGGGSVFRIRLPLEICEEETGYREPADDTFIRAPEARILVVDDNAINLNVASGLLRLRGIDCDTAFGGREAIKKIEEKKYDIVFMDHMMPEMDGLETTRLLRERGYGQDDLVIVALTANAVEGAQQVFEEAGMNDALFKPISGGSLNRVLEKWLPGEKVLRVSATHDTLDFVPSKAQDLLYNAVSGIEGLNINLGLRYSGGMYDVYEQSLGIFIRRLPEVIGRAERFLAEDDRKSFYIEIHGMKGSLSNIGATVLAARAERLESAVRSGDIAFCHLNLPDLISEARAMSAQLAAVVEGKDALPVNAPTGNMEELKHSLMLVRSYIDDFESDEALEILDRLKNENFGENINGTLRDILHLIEEFEYDRGVFMIEQLQRLEVSGGA